MRTVKDRGFQNSTMNTILTAAKPIIKNKNAIGPGAGSFFLFQVKEWRGLPQDNLKQEKEVWHDFE
jgi:hypothetical protein